LSGSVSDVDADVGAVGLHRLKEMVMLIFDQVEAVDGLRRDKLEEVGTVSFRDDDVSGIHGARVSNGEGARVRVEM
jgi:hypothetical protein